MILDSHLNRLFTDKILRFNPIYRCTGFLDYHFHYYKGKKSLFFSHIKHQILPLCKKKMENREKGIIPQNKDLDFGTLEKIILEWIFLNSKETSENKLKSKITSSNWGQLLTIILTLIGVLVSIIVGRENLIEFFNQFLSK